MKELKSRVADMESQTRPSAGIALLESRIQELEERLRSEERLDSARAGVFELQRLHYENEWSGV